MARDNRTVDIGNQYTMKYQQSGLGVDEFIDSLGAKAFDIKKLYKSTNGDYTASFHIMDRVGYGIVTLYYWQSTNQWYAKH